MELITVKELNKTEDNKIYNRTVYELGRYVVTKDVTSYLDDGCEITSISCGTKDPDDEYLPEIYYNYDFFGKKTPYFEIQTTAYGAMSPVEIEKVIDGYKHAIEAVAILTDTFCK